MFALVVEITGCEDGDQRLLNVHRYLYQTPIYKGALSLKVVDAPLTVEPRIVYSKAASTQEGTESEVTCNDIGGLAWPPT